MDNCEHFYKKASRINDQTTESSVVVITIIFMIKTKLIEIAVKYTTLTLMLFFFFSSFFSVLSFTTVAFYLLWATCLSSEKTFVSRCI